MSEPYRRKRTFYQDVSGQFNILAATDDTILKAVRNVQQTIYLQKLHIEVTAGSGSVTWTFTDTANTPINLIPSVSAASIAHFDFDFGPEGIPLTAGKGFKVDVSGTGAVGWVSWEAYQKLSATTAAGSD